MHAPGGLHNNSSSLSARSIPAMVKTACLDVSIRRTCSVSVMVQTAYTVRVGQNHIYGIWCMYGIFGREITKYTVIYGDYIRFWPTLYMP
jgi:hypothetical protein